MTVIVIKIKIPWILRKKKDQPLSVESEEYKENKENTITEEKKKNKIQERSVLAARVRATLEVS